MNTLPTRCLGILLWAAAPIPALAGDVPDTLLSWWQADSPIAGMPTTPARPIPGSDNHGSRPLLSISLVDPDATTLLETRHAGWNSWLDRRFMLSMDHWETGNKDQAHIRCDSGMQTGQSYRAENCRFVATPAAADRGLDLMRIGGKWLASPEFSVGMGVFRGINTDNMFSSSGLDATDTLQWRQPAEGIDLNLSLGLDAGGVGDLLVDLQLSRFRENSGEILGLPDHDELDWSGIDARHDYGSAAQLSLGWRKGDFSGGIQGQVREMPTWWLNATGQNTFSRFDIEFSWRAPWNASFSIGASNFLDNQPVADPQADATSASEPLDGIYGRIPYVRYKQDL